ncbi:MAG: hypothetical protein JJT96_20560 [Opitutales bacterium]|nr:hypothetical protein [Opitutales bacterium]
MDVQFLFGGFAGALAGGIGYGFEGGFGDAFGRAKELARAAAHGINGGVMSELGGGSFRAGFLGGSFGSAASHYGPQFDNFGANLVKSAVIGGTASKLGGGKFENGAISAAFQHLFNSGMSRLRDSTFDGGTGIPTSQDNRLQVSGSAIASSAGSSLLSTGIEQFSVTLEYTVAWYSGSLMGAAAWTDGVLNVLPGFHFTPLESLGLYDSSHYGLRHSQILGGLSRDAYLLGRAGGIGFLHRKTGTPLPLGERLFFSTLGGPSRGTVLGGMRFGSFAGDLSFTWAGRVHSFHQVKNNWFAPNDE